jgi:hypothetical protein
MKSDPIIEYRGITISFDRGNFIADGENWDAKSPSLASVCDKIDRQLAGSFVPTPVFWEGYGRDDFMTGIATSVNENGEIYISHPEKKGYGAREKLSGPVYLDTPENRALYMQIKGIREELSTVAEGYKNRANEVKAKMATLGGKITKTEATP